MSSAVPPASLGETARKTLLGLALMVAILPLLTTWSAILRDSNALLLAGGTALAVLTTGIVLRAFRVQEAVVVLAEILMLAAVLLGLAWLFDDVTRLPNLLATGARHLATSVAPVPAHLGTTVLVCLIVGVLTLLTDVLVIALDRPVALLVPLLALLLIPALGPKVHTPPIPGLFFFAAGVAAVLLVSHRRPAGGRPLTAGLLATATAAAVTALAVFAAVAVAPTIYIPPSARGTDGEPIQMSDVSLQLRREISQGTNRPALEYTTDGATGVYLRLYSLPTFNADGWHLTNSNVAVGALGRPPGVDPGAPRRRTTVTVTGLRSEWLPAPYAPLSTSAGPDWGYLPDNLAILALGVPDRRTATAGLTYTVDSLDVRPSAAQVAAAAAARPPDADLTAPVPADISPELVRIAQEITRDAPTAGAKAQAILAYLKRPEFTYSLDAQAGSGYASLEDFLLKDHRGFCVQYAASMAILARIAGIPSRMAIGFTPGRKTGDKWTVTMHDMHAWPELYLAGQGWVAFEPTPGIGTGQAAPTSSPTASPTSTPSPTAAPSASTTMTVSASPSPSAAPAPARGTPPWLPLVGALALLLAGAALLVAPSRIRLRQRAGRLAGGSGAAAALGAWTELRALARDHGRDWPAGSPRYAAEEVAGWVDPAAADGVRRLALAAELAEFGGPEHEPDARDWTPEVDAFAAGLDRSAATRWERLRARWLPPSVLG